MYWEWLGVFAGWVVSTLLVGTALSFVPSFIDNIVFEFFSKIVIPTCGLAWCFLCCWKRMREEEQLEWN